MEGHRELWVLHGLMGPGDTLSSSPQDPEVWEVRPEPLRCRWRRVCGGPEPPTALTSPGAARSSASLRRGSLGLC